MFAAFEASSRAIRAQQRGLDVTANNIANLNTPGYTRQELILSESDPMHYPGFSLGTGVFANDIKQYREEWLDREMRNSLSRQAGYNSDNSIFQQIQTMLSEPGDQGLDTSMDKFFTAVEELSSKPDDIGLRSNLLSAANHMTGTFNSVATGLHDMRGQVYRQLDANVTMVNRLLAGIADLNASIVSTRSNDGELSGTLLDQQNVLVEQLAKLGDVQLTRTTNGSASISMNGNTAVINDTAMTLGVQQNINGLTGEVTAAITVQDPLGNSLGSYKPATGEMASQLKAYNVTLDDRDSSGGYSIARELDTLANTLATKINAIAQTGYGLDDTGPTPPGRDFFSSSVVGQPVSAMNMRVDPALLADPRLIPTSGLPGTPGNNDILLLLGQLVNDQTFISNQTAREFYGQSLTQLANAGADSMSGKSVADATIGQISSQRESVVGVNMDEEAINMIKFQRAFEAAARMISATSDMLKTVVNLGL